MTSSLFLTTTCCSVLSHTTTWSSEITPSLLLADSGADEGGAAAAPREEDEATKSRDECIGVLSAVLVWESILVVVRLLARAVGGIAQGHSSTSSSSSSSSSQRYRGGNSSVSEGGCARYPIPDYPIFYFWGVRVSVEIGGMFLLRRGPGRKSSALKRARCHHCQRWPLLGYCAEIRDESYWGAW